MECLPAPWLQHLERKNLADVDELLVAHEAELMEQLNLGSYQAHALKRTLAFHVASTPCTAASMLQRASHAHPIPCGLPDLDDALRGGLPVGAITELVGPSGAGKSQFCLTAILQAVAPRPWGMQGTVVLVDTEGKFSTARLVEMAKARLSQNPGSPPLASESRTHRAAMHSLSRPAHLQGTARAPPPRTAVTPDTAQTPLSGAALDQAVEGLLQRVMLMHPKDMDQLMHALFTLQAQVAQQSACLVVLDSIAALARVEFEVTKVSLMERANMLGRAASVLKAVAEQHQLPVLVTNQVTARMSDEPAASHQLPNAWVAAGREGGSAQQSWADDGRHSGGKAPRERNSHAALGTAWAHAVNVRIIMERFGNVRRLQLVKSPASPNMAVDCCIKPAGVEQMRGPLPVPVQGSMLDISLSNILPQQSDAGYDQ